MADLRLPSINFVILSGRVVEDAVLRYTPQGVPTCTVRFASDRSFKNSQGEWVKEALFINLVIFRQAAERSASRLKRGTPIIVEGNLRSREYEDARTGVKRTIYEIVVRRIHFLEKQVSEEMLPPEIEEEEYPEELSGIDSQEIVENPTIEDQEEEDLPF
ncbi:MAG: single-stranded DNA-binding protein [Candidatus Hydrothermia bacterium]